MLINFYFRKKKGQLTQLNPILAQRRRDAEKGQIVGKDLYSAPLRLRARTHNIKDNENRMPPRIHNLVKLAENTNIALSEDLKVFLDEATDFNLEVRYPGYTTV